MSDTSVLKSGLFSKVRGLFGGRAAPEKQQKHNVFPDRRAVFFGREKDINRLTYHARTRGITAVVGRPLVGKTWALQDMARGLTDEGKYLFGYHEAVGTESSHLLYAISQLYINWLSDGKMRNQAFASWEQYKNSVVPNIATMVGTLFEKLGEISQDDIAAVVNDSFKRLAESQKNLFDGGLKQLPTLSYNEALSLISLVANISKLRIVLILDAWEKPHSIRSDVAVFEAFLKRLDDWPEFHIFVGIRAADAAATKVNQEALKRMRDLQKLSAAASVYELPLMTIDGKEVVKKFCTTIRGKHPALKQFNDQEMLQVIGGFPGVLYFWDQGSNFAAVSTKDDFNRLAVDSQALNYAEFDSLLKALPETQGVSDFVARLAFLPRLDADKWKLFKRLLLADATEAEVDKLVASHLLENEEFPVFGHDTRHTAARQWFIANRPEQIKRVAEALIESLAAITNQNNAANHAIVEVLAACFESAKQVGVEQIPACLIHAAKAVIGDADDVINPAFDEAYPAALQKNAAFTRLIAYAIFVRGNLKGLRGDVEGEIVDCNAVLSLPNIPPELVVIALNGRGFAKGRLADVEGALADCTTATTLPGASAQQIAISLHSRGYIKAQHDDTDGAIEDYTAAIVLPNAPSEQVAKALNYRGEIKYRRGDVEGAIADYSTAIDLPNAPIDQVAKSFNYRGLIKDQRGETDEAIADYTAAIDLPYAPAEQVVFALNRRGVAKKQRRDAEGEISDYTAAIALQYAPVEQVIKALGYRGIAKLQSNDVEGAIIDWTAVTKLPAATIEQIAIALYNRGVAKNQKGDVEEATADWNAVTTLRNSPAHVVAMAKASLSKGAFDFPEVYDDRHA